MDKLKVCVIGSTGLVGKEFCRRLAVHPYFEIGGLYASENRPDITFQDLAGNDALPDLGVEKTDIDSILSKKYDLIFSAVSEKTASTIELELSWKGQRVFTNASGNRMRQDVPILVPEINREHMILVGKNNGFIVANGNCSTISLALSVAPLMELEMKKIDVTTMQAVSGAGYPGIPALDVISCVYPHIPGEEKKISSEIKKIFGTVHNNAIEPSEISVNPICTRIPVRDGHTEAVFVELQENVEENDVKNSFRNFRNGKIAGKNLPSLPYNSVIFHDSPERPHTNLDLNAGKNFLTSGMPVSVGHFSIKGNMVSFISLIHNIVRGAAGSSILNAEFLHREGFL